MNTQISEEIIPFRIEVSDAVLDDLRQRLARTRWPAPSPDQGWKYGTELTYLQELCEYWRTTYDWRAAEARLNVWPHFLTSIDGEQIHFIHARSDEPNAMPLLLTHGWPGSVTEFLDIIEPLRDPAAFGGDPADAFHVICPSLPGYGWSGPTHQESWNIRRVAEAFAVLMARLGYERYGAQGGDWGALATMNLGYVDPIHVAGIHLNMVVAPPLDPANPTAGLTPTELQAMADMQHFQEHETGYQAIQGSKPQTLGYGLTDSPAGLAAWIVEKFRTWADCDGDIESVFTKDQLLTNITTYWVTETISSSTRLYYESRRGGGRGSTLPGNVTVPTGVARFPKEIYRPARAWVEAVYHLTHWSEFPKGGHFAAMEQPEALVGDIRAFFRTVR